MATRTSSFGAGRRESHDATDYDARFVAPEFFWVASRTARWPGVQGALQPGGGAQGFDTDREYVELARLRLEQERAVPSS